MAQQKRRTRHQYDNAKPYPPGQDVESAALSDFIARGMNPKAAERSAKVIRVAFERSCRDTDDPGDAAHGKIDGMGWLFPPGDVPNARRRKYPPACLVEVEVCGIIYRVSVDSACEQLGERAEVLSRAGIPMGYLGSVTGAQQQRARGPKDESTYAYAESIAAARGKTLRDLTRQRTRQRGAEDPEERALEREANRILREAER